MKYAAVVCMLCDHIGFLFFSGNAVMTLILRHIIGRMAFPVFLVLFCDGWVHVRKENYLRHIRDLFIAAIAACPGFWYMTTGRWSISLTHWNVMFAFLLCLFMYLCLDYLGRQKKEFGADAVLLLRIIVICLFSVIAGCLAVDYGASAPLYAGILYMVRRYGGHPKDSRFPGIWFRAALCVLVCAAMTWNAWEFMGLVPFLFYDEKKQDVKRHKYFFYWFYPLHLLILGLIRTATH